MQLREEYDASRNTVRDALTWLVERGVVVTERGKGSFVAYTAKPLHITMSAREIGPGGGEGSAWVRDVEGQGREPTNDGIQVEIKAASPDIARYLQVEEGTQVVARRQRRRVDGQPWSLQASYYPLEFTLRGAPRLLEATDMAEGVVAYLKETLGLEQGGYHDEIAVRTPDADEARLLVSGDRANVLVYETFRTAYTSDGLAFRVTVTVWPADLNRLHYNVGSVPQAVVDRPDEPHLDKA